MGSPKRFIAAAFPADEKLSICIVVSPPDRVGSPQDVVGAESVDDHAYDICRKQRAARDHHGEGASHFHYIILLTWGFFFFQLQISENPGI